LKLEILENRLVPAVTLEWRDSMNDHMWHTLGNWWDVTNNRVATALPTAVDTVKFDINYCNNCHIDNEVVNCKTISNTLFSGFGYTGTIILDNGGVLHLNGGTGNYQDGSIKTGVGIPGNIAVDGGSFSF